METVWRVATHAGGGLDGDRYQLGTGHYADKPAPGQAG